MQLKLLNNFFFSSCPFFGVTLTLPRSLHVLKADVSSLPYAKCRVGCDKPLAFQCLLCEEEHDADGGGFFLLIFWVHLGFFHVFPHHSMLPSLRLSAAAPHPQRTMVCLAVTWGDAWNPPQMGHPQNRSWSRGGSSHWARHRCYDKANPVQAKTSTDKSWDPAVNIIRSI